MRKFAWGVVLMTLLLQGCGGSTVEIIDVPPVQTVEPGKYIFAAVFTNAAWNKQNKGIVIKGNGDLYSFDVSTTTASLPESDLTDEAALTRYFEAATFNFVKALDKTELTALWKSALPVGNTTLGAKTSICRDAGSFQYLMFQPTGSSAQKTVMMYLTGDWRQEQTDSRAKPVKELLIKLALEQKIAWQLDPAGNNWCSGM